MTRPFKPTITAARAVCEAMGARQVVVLSFDSSGRFGATSYGQTRAECAAVRPVCEAAALLASGELTGPGTGRWHRAPTPLQEAARKVAASLEQIRARMGDGPLSETDEAARQALDALVEALGTEGCEP